MGEEFTFTWIQCQWRQILIRGMRVQTTQMRVSTPNTMSLLSLLNTQNWKRRAKRPLNWVARALPQLLLQLLPQLHRQAQLLPRQVAEAVVASVAVGSSPQKAEFRGRASSARAAQFDR